jgi:Protein of unknown function (DUF3237)
VRVIRLRGVGRAFCADYDVALAWSAAHCRKVRAGLPVILPDRQVTDNSTEPSYEFAAEARFEGKRLNASLAGHAAADWLTTSATSAVATPDVRMTLKTDDGALVFMHYQGRADFSAGPAGAIYYTAPKFDVGDPRYRWLAAIQAVGKARLSADLRTLVHEIYEVR